MDYAAIVYAAELFRGNSQELHVVWQELLVYGKEQSEAAGEYQTETEEDQERSAVTDQDRDQALVVVGPRFCVLLSIPDHIVSVELTEEATLYLLDLFLDIDRCAGSIKKASTISKIDLLKQ